MPIDLGQPEAEIPVTPFPLQEWGSQVNRFVDRAVFFANQNRDPQDIHDAWRTFRVWLSSWIDYNSDDWRLFLVWYIFHWQAPAASLEVPCRRVPSIAEEYLEKQPQEISESERKMVASAISSPMDFYEIHDFPELNCVYVKSLFLGFQHSYAFNELPEGLGVGDIFFAKIIHFQDDRGVIAAYSQPFSAMAKVSIAHMRRQLISGRKEEFVKNFPLFDTDLFNLYHDLLSKESYDS